MRTPEVEIAISNTKAGMYCTDDADTLAAEVERLEEEVDFYKRHSQQMTDVGNGLYQAIVARLEPHFPAGSRDLEWDALPGTLGALAKRAEAAEARVKELEAEALNGRHAVFTDLKAQLAAANEQNARLRAALEAIERARPALYDMNTLLRFAGIAGDTAKAALNGEEASK